MNQSALKSAMRLFALVYQFNTKQDSIADVRNAVAIFLAEHTTPTDSESYLTIFDYHQKTYYKENPSRKRLSLLSVKATLVASEAVDYLPKSTRILLLLTLADILSNGKGIVALDLIRTIGSIFHLYQNEVDDIIHFMTPELSYRGRNILIVSGSKEQSNQLHSLYEPLIAGELHILYNHFTHDIFFRYTSSNEIFLRNGSIVMHSRVYRLAKGGVIENYKIPSLPYGRILQLLGNASDDSRIHLRLDDVSYHFPDGIMGIHPISVTMQSGEMIGVMGNSGTGKTTLLNLMAGNLSPSKGRVLLNGHPWGTLGASLPSLVGFIPQDDLLIKELTVFQNLYLTARLSFQHLNQRECAKLVIRTLEELGLDEVKHLQVGTPEKGIISGGQRKRLNMSLEFVRDPSIFFIDEPTTGLSSADSERIISIIKGKTQLGKLAVVNIHQPSSSAFKLFDKILILDHGGRVVYYGNPIDSIVHFKMVTSQINPAERECQSCGNVNPEQVLNTIEEKKLRADGALSEHRKYTPDDWYRGFKETLSSEGKEEMPTEVQLPVGTKATYFRQFRTFLQRNILSMLADRQYLMITLLEAPLLAFLLSYISKHYANPHEQYTFFLNQNMPAFFFMSIMVAMFLGLMLSAEGIIKDRHIVKREKFLGLSRSSYINSKLTCLLATLSLQVLLFVLLSTAILGIKGMTFLLWFALFSIAFNAAMLGLNLSSGLRTTVAIYISIPILLMPQILLNGSLIPFDKLHPKLASGRNVPWVANMAVSRWGYEALLLAQYTSHSIQRELLPVNIQESQIRFAHSYLIPELEQLVAEMSGEVIGVEPPNPQLLLNGLVRVGNPTQIRQRAELFLNDNSQKDSLLMEIRVLKRQMANDLNSISSTKNSFIANKAASMGGMQVVIDLYDQYSNEAVNDLLLGRNNPTKIIRGTNEFTRRFEPLFYVSPSKIGNSPFYSAFKRVGEAFLNTYWYNMIIIWFITAILYVALYFDWLKRFISAFFRG